MMSFYTSEEIGASIMAKEDLDASKDGAEQGDPILERAGSRGLLK